MEIMKKAMDILENYSLCDYCLGRQFSNAATGLSNKERGNVIKTMLTMELSYSDINKNIEKLQKLSRSGSWVAKKILTKNGFEACDAEKCYICNDSLNLIDDFVKLIIPAVSEYEFDTFLIGTKIPKDMFQQENELKKEFDVANSEYLKQEFNREIAKKLIPIINKQTDFKNPHIIIECDYKHHSISLKIRSLYIYGRYNKLIRTIPQTHWLCRKCKGKGCEYCNYTGKMYAESVEEIIGEKILELTRGKAAILHGSGREDIDVRMLGNGRPFVIEITEPKIRTIDVNELEPLINKFGKDKVAVKGLRWSSRKEIVYLKTTAQQSLKKYMALVEFEKAISEEDISKIEKTFENIELKQQTPNRVLHRRADKIRHKVVYYVKCQLIDSHHMKSEISCSGGTYIKELISGDEGRTTPSFTSVLNNPAKCIELDVIGIYESEMGYN